MKLRPNYIMGRQGKWTVEELKGLVKRHRDMAAKYRAQLKALQAKRK